MELLRKNFTWSKMRKANKKQSLDKFNKSTNVKGTALKISQSYLNKQQLKEIGDVLEILGHSNDLDIIPPKHLITKLKEPNNEIIITKNYEDIDLNQILLEVGDEVVSIFVEELKRFITISIYQNINNISSRSFIIEERMKSLELTILKVKRCIVNFSEMIMITLSSDFQHLLIKLKFTKEEAILIFYYILNYFLLQITEEENRLKIRQIPTDT